MGVYIKSRFSYDPDALAFIQASSIPNTSQKLAVNQLVLDLKAYGLWSKMKAIYPMVGGSAFYHKWNLKDPRDLDAAFRLNFVGGWTHSSTGAKGNGTNAWAATYLIPNTHLTNNSTHVSYYSRTNSAEDGTAIGGIAGDAPNYSRIAMWIRWSTNQFFSDQYNDSTNRITVANTDSRGLFTSNRTASNLFKAYRNGSVIGTNTNASINLTNANQYLALNAYHQAGSALLYSARECAFASIGDGLTDTEAANFYTAVQNFQIALGRSIGTQTVSDADAQAFINAAVIEDQIQATAINQLVIDMKGYGLWSKMKAVYPFVGGTAASHKWNLKNPLDTNAAFRLTFTGGWTHSATGALPNGTNGYANTYLTSNGTLLQNSTHISYYSRTQSNGTEVEMGSASGPNAAIDPGSLIEIRTSNVTYFRINSLGNYITYTDADSRAFYISNRTASNVINGWRNNVKVATGSIPSSGLSINTMTIGAFNQSGIAYYSTKECAFSSIGDGLSDTEAANFYTVVQNFNTALNRQVI